MPRLKTFALLAFAVLAVMAFITLSSRVLAWPNAGRIVATSDPLEPRFGHRSALLPSGKVLLVGGMARNGVFSTTTELYDPITGRFTAAGKTKSLHGWGATATLLPNGKVLIAGGSVGPMQYLATTELYDPLTDSFSTTGNMTAPRAGAEAVLLPSGKVLIAGGDPDDEKPLASAELYDPATGTFAATGSMRTARDGFVAVLLKDGKVLVAGGSSTGQHAVGIVEEKTAEIYDPFTGRFTLTGNMTMPRNKLGAAPLADGRALIVGGQIGGARGARVASTEIYDPVAGGFTPGPTMNYTRFKIPDGVVALKNGRILIAGGADQPEVYDPASGRLLPTTGAKLDAYLFSTATLLSDGRVLLVGGYGSHAGVGAINHAWLYQP